MSLWTTLARPWLLLKAKAAAVTAAAAAENAAAGGPLRHAVGGAGGWRVVGVPQEDAGECVQEDQRQHQAQDRPAGD